DYKVTGVQTCALPISSLPSGRRNCAARAVPSPAMPAASRIALTLSASSSQFFAEKASIDGGTTQMRDSSRPSQAKDRREKMHARSEERRVGKECRSRG